jgi:hypothetical protein
VYVIHYTLQVSGIHTFIEHFLEQNKRGYKNVKFAERQIIRKTDDETTGGSLDEVN